MSKMRQSFCGAGLARTVSGTRMQEQPGSVLIETDLGVVAVDSRRSDAAFVELCRRECLRNTLISRVEPGFVAHFALPVALHGLQPSADALEWRGHVLFCSPTRLFLALGDGSTDRYAHLRQSHAVLGRVAEDAEQVVHQLNTRIGVDAAQRPLRDVRVRRTVVLLPPLQQQPADGPPPRDFALDTCPEEWDVIEERPSILDTHVDEQAVDRAALLAETNAIKLEILGDLPSADARPDENALFVCKLNPITTSSNLRIIFSRYGRVVECEVKRDARTGDSLQYAFVHFAERASCEEAYRKMQNVMIDGRRIRIDFSQSQGRKRSAAAAAAARPCSPSSSSSEEKKKKKHHKKSKKHKKDRS